MGEVPAEAEQAGQYGPRLRSYAIYLKDYALLPFHRNAQLMEDFFWVQLSPGTLEGMEQEYAQRLQPIGEQLRQAVRAAEVMHFDVTEVSINLARKSSVRPSYKAQKKVTLGFAKAAAGTRSPRTTRTIAMRNMKIRFLSTPFDEWE